MDSDAVHGSSSEHRNMAGTCLIRRSMLDNSGIAENSPRNTIGRLLSVSRWSMNAGQAKCVYASIFISLSKESKGLPDKTEEHRVIRCQRGPTVARVTSISAAPPQMAFTAAAGELLAAILYTYFLVITQVLELFL